MQGDHAGSTIVVATVDPSDPQARECVDAYFAELDRRFEAGFDPGRSISADDEELRPPAGLLVLAWLAGRPVGCRRFEVSWRRSGRPQTHVGGRLGARSWCRSSPAHRARSDCCIARRTQAGGSRRTGRSWRRSSSTAPPATWRSPRSATSPTPTTGSRNSSVDSEGHSGAPAGARSRSMCRRCLVGAKPRRS